MVVRRVLSNILDRIEIEEKREKERRGKRKSKSKKSRGPSKSTDEKEQIRYFGKLDILLGRRKVRLRIKIFAFFYVIKYLACNLLFWYVVSPTNCRNERTLNPYFLSLDSLTGSTPHTWMVFTLLVTFSINHNFSGAVKENVLQKATIFGVQDP